MKKFSALAALVLAASLLMTGCGAPAAASSDTSKAESSTVVAESKAEETNESSEAEAETVAATGGTLRMGTYVLDTELANKSPFATSGTFADMLKVIYEPLFVYNEKRVS